MGFKNDGFTGERPGAGEKVKRCSAVENSLMLPQLVKHRISISTPLLGVCPEELEAAVQTKTSVSVLTAALS